MILRIKNMCCRCCIDAVRTLLQSSGLTVNAVSLGDADIVETLTTEQQKTLAARLHDLGFELLDDPQSCLVEQIRVCVLQWVRMTGEHPKLSEYVSDTLHRDYSSLSKLFTQVRGVTIEHFAIELRVEYAKELLCYSHSPISDIAYQLGYSSPAHLASQFKQLTGLSPKLFRELDTKARRSLDEI